MSLSIAELNSVSKRYFDPTMKSQVYEESPFWAKLKKANQITVSGGTDIQWGIRYKELGNAAAVQPRQQLSFQSVQTRTAATADWTYYWVHTMMHWDEKLKNAGAGRIVDLAKDKAKEMGEDFDELMIDDLFATTQGANSFVSLPLIIDSANSYGGIAVADCAAWASTEDSSTTRMLLYGTASLSYMVNQATFGKRGPTLHITTRDLWTKYESLLEPQVRYEDQSMADLGFDSLKLKGKPVTSDAHCPASMWLGIDMDAFEFIVHPDYNMKLTGWLDLTLAGFPEAVGRVMTHACAMKCDMRQTSFKYSALDYTA